MSSRYDIALFLLAGDFNLPTEAKEWTGRDFQMSRIELDSKKNREVFVTIAQALNLTCKKKKSTCCTVVN